MVRARETIRPPEEKAMSALVPTHKPGNRLLVLSPFDLDERGAPQDAAKKEAQCAVPQSAYGCVEWFQYLDHSVVTASAPGAAPSPHDARRA
jgi:hypothetical protein